MLKIDIIDLYQLSEWQREIIRIAHDLEHDTTYTKDDAIKDLVKFASVMNMEFDFDLTNE